MPGYGKSLQDLTDRPIYDLYVYLFIKSISIFVYKLRLTNLFINIKLNTLIIKYK